MNIFKIACVYFGFLFLSLSAAECSKEYDRYPVLEQEGWSIRIDDKLDEYGCGIIEIYESLRKVDNVLLMDSMDDDPRIIAEIQKLFNNRKVFNLIQENEVVKNILMDNSDNYQLLKNTNYLLDKYLNSAKRKAILKNPIYLNYFILPSANTKDNNKLEEYYRDLNKISVEGLGLFSFIFGAIGDDYQFEYLLENFFTIKDVLSKNQVKEIAQYPEQLAYFLYPSKEDMKLYGDDVRYEQKQFQELMITIYKSTYDHFQYKQIDENIISLLTMEKIYPYVVDNQNYHELNKLFKVLAARGYIEELWQKVDNICDKKSAEEVFAVFGDNNLNNLLKLQKYENDLYHHLLKSDSQYRSIFSLFYTANVYAKFDHKKWKLFKDLLYGFSSDIYENILVVKELDNIEYFQKIIQQYDYNYFVKANDDDVHGKSSKKYKFILLTSYPSDNDYSPYQYLASGNSKKAKKILDELYGKRIDDLQTHNFTLFEKNMAMIDAIDNTLTVAAIVAVPFTGGISLGYVALKKGATVGAKKGIKLYAKKLALKSRKLLNKSISLARKSRSALHNGIGKKATSSLGKGLGKAEDSFSTFALSAMVGGALFLAIPNDLEAKQICEEK